MNYVLYGNPSTLHTIAKASRHPHLGLPALWKFSPEGDFMKFCFLSIINVKFWNGSRLNSIEVKYGLFPARESETCKFAISENCMLADDSVYVMSFTLVTRACMQPLRVITLLRGRNYSKSALQLLSLPLSLSPHPEVFMPVCSGHETLLLINTRFVARAEPDDSLEFTGYSNIR